MKRREPLAAPFPFGARRMPVARAPTRAQCLPRRPNRRFAPRKDSPPASLQRPVRPPTQARAPAASPAPRRLLAPRTAEPRTLPRATGQGSARRGRRRGWGPERRPGLAEPGSRAREGGRGPAARGRRRERRRGRVQVRAEAKDGSERDFEAASRRSVLLFPAPSSACFPPSFPPSLALRLSVGP